MVRTAAPDGLRRSSLLRGSGRAVVSNLLLLGACGGLLLFGPGLAPGLLAEAPPQTSSGFLNAAGAAGITCGASAATLLLVWRLVGQASTQRYAAPACLLVGFVGMLLWGLAPAWPFAVRSGAPLGHLALAFSLVGGGLVALDAAPIFGACLTLLPALTLFGICWAHVGDPHPAAAWFALAPALRLSLGLLGATTLLLIALAECARRPRRSRVAVRAGRKQAPRLQVARDGTAEDMPAPQPSSLREAILATRSDWRSWPLPETKALLRVPRNFMTEMRSRRAASLQRARSDRERKS
jgi:hypothetical protein